ncbi:MAG: hypothetical protein ACK47B_27075 [Armatimonadota bacterium]
MNNSNEALKVVGFLILSFAALAGVLFLRNMEHQPPLPAPQATPSSTAQSEPMTACLNCNGAGQVACYSCRGSGRCAICRGSGGGGPKNALGYYGDCTWCRGTGMCHGQLQTHWDGLRVCEACRGSGQITVAQAQQVQRELQEWNNPQPRAYNPNDPYDANDEAVMKVLTSPQ